MCDLDSNENNIKIKLTAVPNNYRLLRVSQLFLHILNVYWLDKIVESNLSTIVNYRFTKKEFIFKILFHHFWAIVPNLRSKSNRIDLGLLLCYSFCYPYAIPRKSISNSWLFTYYFSEEWHVNNMWIAKGMAQEIGLILSPFGRE